MTELEGQDNRKPQFVGMYVSVAVFLLCAIFRNGTSSLESSMVRFFMLAAASALFRAVSTDWHRVQQRALRLRSGFPIKCLTWDLGFTGRYVSS